MSKLAHLSVLQKVWFASITALVLLLAINAMQSYQAITELKDQEISSGTTKAKLRSAKEVFSSVQDAELHLLAYLISHKQHHLDLYFKSLERLDEHVSELKQLSYQLPQQHSIFKPSSKPYSLAWMKCEKTSTRVIKNLTWRGY